MSTVAALDTSPTVLARTPAPRPGLSPGTRHRPGRSVRAGAPHRSPGSGKSSAPGGGLPLSLVVLLGALTAVPSLSLDFYLPALPDIERQLGTNQATAQLTMTGCLLGFALGLLVAGPLSDAYGRRRPLLVGVAVYTLATAACAAAPTVEVLIGLRVLQGAAGAFGMVAGNAIVRDRVSGAAAAKMFSVLMLANGAAPILGPLLGGQLLLVTDWRGLFAFLGVIGALVLLACLRGLPETLPADRRRAASPREAVRTFGSLLHDRPLVGYTLGRALGASALLAYISASPFVFQGVYGLSAQTYGVVFGVNSLGLIAMGQLSGRLVGRFGSGPLLRAGMYVCAGGAVALLAVLLVHAPLPVVLPAVFAVVAGMGLVFPNSTALGLTRHGECAGATTALMGVAQFTLQTLTSPLTGLGPSGSALPMGVVVLALDAAGLVALLALTRTRTPVASWSVAAPDGADATAVAST